MKRTLQQILAGTALATLLLTACAKKKNETGSPVLPPDQTKALIADGAWIFQHETVVYGPDEVDHGGGDACKLDDTWRFDLSGDATVTWGANDCFSGFLIPAGTYGSWLLRQNGSELQLTYDRYMPGGYAPGDVVVWSIDFLSDRKMVLKRTVSEPGKTYLVYDTYVKGS
ncbi:MAG: hypothetical protein EOO11_15445 [Chitinophagaceae bacterium]|nr:MAG: hypothetical protein EOO11_15445 [Chitinophagaceae bacterium]